VWTARRYSRFERRLIMDSSSGPRAVEGHITKGREPLRSVTF